MSQTEIFGDMLDQLTFLYGPERAAQPFERLRRVLADFQRAHPEPRAGSSTGERLTEDDVVLITYGDQVREPSRPPLQTLAEVLTTTLGEVVSAVHILPFYPYSSDDGFSVIDYTAVDPQLG